jgi:hypothetical protein
MKHHDAASEATREKRGPLHPDGPLGERMAEVWTTNGFSKGRIVGVAKFRSPTRDATRSAFLEAFGELCAADNDVAETYSYVRNETERNKAQQFEAQKRGEILARADALRAMVDSDRTGLTAERAGLLSPPPATGHDAVLDVEARAAFVALPERQRQALEAEMSAGGHERLVLALSRSLVPTPASVFGRRVWEERASKQHAEALKQLDQLAEGCTQIEAAIDAMRGAVA